MCSKSKTANTVELPSDGCMDNKNSKSQSDDGVHEGDGHGETVGATEVPQSVPRLGLDGKYGLEHRHLQHVASTRPAGVEYLVPQAQPELLGHSIACVPYPYSNPYYGGLMTAYGAQALVNPHLLGMHQPRMCLPLEMTEDPVYVNPKQYNGIMRRRKSRAKAELERKLIKNRKPYLHESRHQHAMRRERGCGGRFLNKKKLNDGAKPTLEEHMESSAAPSTQSTSPTGSAVTTHCTGKLNASIGHGEFEGLMSGQHTYSNEDGDGNSFYQDRQDFKVSAFHSLTSGERGEEGDCSGQLRGSILVRQASQRALTIQ